MVQLSKVPAVCIGGIKDYNIERIKNIGCSAIAVMSYLTNSKEPAKMFEKLNKIIN